MEEFKYILLMFVVSFVLFIRLRFNSGEKKRKPIPYLVINTIFVLLFIFYFAFRLIYSKDGVIIGGVDAPVYKARFENATGNFIEALKMQEYEFGYGTFVYVVRLFTNNYVVFECIYYLITFTMIFYIIDNLHMKFNLVSLILIFVYIVMPLFDSMNIARNIFSFFISFCAVIKFSQNKKWSCLILSVIAISVHLSAVLLIPVYILYRLVKNDTQTKPNKLIYFIIFVSVLIVFFVGITVLEIILASTKYSAYFEGSTSFPFGLLIERFTAAGLYLFLAIKTKEDIKLSKIGLILLVVGIDITLLQIRLPILYRVNSICSIGCFIVYNNINKDHKDSLVKGLTPTKVFINVVLIAFVAFKISSLLSDAIASYGLLPHYFYWEDIKNIRL